jgi:hypothetical protein
LTGSAGGGRRPKLSGKAANVVAYRELLLDVGFADAETRSIAGDVFRPLARFLSKSLFAPERKYVNPLLRITVRPDNFWIHETHIDYILAVA